MIHSGNFLELWFNNIFTIIDVLIIASLVLVFLVGIFSFRETKKIESGESFSDLESALKRVLENTEVKATTVSRSRSSASASGVGASVEGDFEAGDMDLPAEALEQLSTLKTELEGKELEVVGLRDKLESLESSGGVSSEVEAKLKDLEAKLQEYEIIEDDIANLSLYKQENAKLKQEIDKMKSGIPGLASDSSVSETPQTPASPVAPVGQTEETTSENEAQSVEPSETDGADDDIMAEFAAAVSDQKKETSSAKETAPAEEEVLADDDIMAEFAAAVSEQKTGATQQPEAPAASESEDEQDDIMAEFAAAVDEQKSGALEPVVEAKTSEQAEDDIMAEFAAAVQDQNSGKAVGDEKVQSTDLSAVAASVEDVEVSAPEIEKESLDTQTKVEVSQQESSNEEDDDEESVGFASLAADPSDATPQGEDIMGEFSETPELSAEAESEEVDLASLIDPEDILEDESPDVIPVEERQSQVPEEVSSATAEKDTVYSADDLIDENTFDQFNKEVKEQREARKVKEEEIAAKVAELGIGIDVKEAVTDQDMDKFRQALGVKTSEPPVSEEASAETNFLDGEMDTDKILDEVGELASISVEAGDESDEEDPGAQLIAEFENFTQKV